MSEDPRLQRLLDRLLDSDATPEEVCVSCPELLDTVRERWQKMRRVRAELEAFFPSPTEAASPPAEAALPQIPGYEVEAVLGRGGMGIVFKARQLQLDRVVALKMLLAGAYAAPEELARFRREATAVASLRHPNIVPVHDAGEVNGRPYFTMEFVEGGTLARSLARTPQQPRRAAELVATLASAVQFAHQSGFIHRDLKPANILLTPAGVPKITDFGLVRSTAAGPEFTRTGFGIGTPSYMAPEQALGNTSAMGPGVDIYALGVILYEMLTGRPPFEGGSAEAIIQKVIDEEVPPPSRVHARVPRDLETICLKCLEKDSKRRYASAQDLADDLHRYLDGKPILARPVGVVERVVKWARRRPAVALLVGTLLALLIVGTGIAVWLGYQGAQRAGQAQAGIQTALKRAADLRQEERWNEALEVVQDASPHLPDARSAELERRLLQAQKDLRIAVVMEKVRESYPLHLRMSDMVDYEKRADDYQSAFNRTGLQVEEDAEAVVDFIRTSTIRDHLVAALEDRAFVAFKRNDQRLVKQLLTIAERADSGSPWRTRFRDPKVWQSRTQLQELAGTAFTSTPGPSEYELALLGLLLREVGAMGPGIHLLEEASRRQPRNFWVHRELGSTLLSNSLYWEAIRSFSAAVALRPDNPGVHERLGRCLFYAGRTDASLAEYRRAMEIPNNLVYPGVFVYPLAESGYWKEAEEVCRRTQNCTDHLHPYYDLGEALHRQKRYDDAAAMYRKAIEKGADAWDVYERLSLALMRAGRHEEAIPAFQKSEELHPGDPAPGYLLPRQLVAIGRWEEAITMLRAANARTPNILYFQFDLGKLLRAHGKPEEATKILQEEVKHAGPVAFLWEELEDSLLDQGRFADARATVEKHLTMPIHEPYRGAEVHRLDLCKSLLAIETNLPSILAGKERPKDPATQLALAEWCLKHKNLTALAASFYTSALEALPAVADDLATGQRFDAARAACLAGTGVGVDAAQLDDQQRARLRKQALDWLTADYNARVEQHRANKPGDRVLAASMVRSWIKTEELIGADFVFVLPTDERCRVAGDLAGVRDETALAKLPSDERRDWQALWKKVAALAARDPYHLMVQARDHVARTEWKEAAKCYAELMELFPTDDGDLWFEYAASQLLAGDREGYRRAREHMLSRCQPQGPMRPYLVARACTLAFESPEESGRALRAGSLELGRVRSEFWALAEQGAVQYRMNNLQSALRYIDQGLAADGRAGRAVLNWLWLALIHQKLGSPTEAQRWLAKANNWLNQQEGRMPLDTPLLGLHLHNWLEAHILRQEAEAAIRKR
jgi:serine/threonine-protein kinase